MDNGVRSFGFMFNNMTDLGTSAKNPTNTMSWEVRDYHFHKFLRILAF